MLLVPEVEKINTQSIVVLIVWFFGLLQVAASETIVPPNFVKISSVDPRIKQDIRYATSKNFVGTAIPGYDAGVCWLRRAAAEALSRAQSELSALGLILILYDCYRPERATRYLLQWARDPEREENKAVYYPSVRKEELFSMGYIARTSAHSRGIAVDLGLARVAGEALPPTPLDFGTTFDFLDPLSRTESLQITKEAQANRRFLVTIM